MGVLTADPRVLGGLHGRLALHALADALAPAPTMLCLDGPWPDDVDDLTRHALADVAALTVAFDPPDAVLADACDLVTADRAVLDGWAAAFERAPYAAVTAALLLRRTPTDAWAGLVAESSAYSLLLSGPEFREWLRCSGSTRSTLSTPADDGTRVRTDRHGSVREVVLTRPSRHNALDTRQRDELHARLLELTATPGPIVLRGDGPSFCSGGDLAEFGTAPGPVEAHVVRLTHSLAVLMIELAPRMVVALHGACIGAGIELPAFAGRVVAADDARFALPELALGLVPGAGGTVSVRRRIGRARLLELLLTGTTIDAATARDWGLVDEVVPRADLVNRAYQLAEEAA